MVAERWALDAGPLLLRLRGCAQVGLYRLVAREDFGGVVVGDGGGDDDVVALLPIGRGGYLVLGGELHGVKHAEDLIEVAAGGHGIGHLQLDLLIGADDIDHAHGGVVGGGAAFAAIAGVAGEHVVELGYLEFGVADDGEVDLGAGDVFDVLGPLRVVFDAVDGEAEGLYAAGGELSFERADGAELGGANGSEVLGVREEDDPVVADELVEVDGALRGFGGEVGSYVIDAERHRIFPLLLISSGLVPDVR